MKCEIIKDDVINLKEKDWILHFKKKISVIAYEVAKISIYIKIVFLIAILTSATVIGILELYFP